MAASAMALDLGASSPYGSVAGTGLLIAQLSKLDPYL
jgi:hypothetical protein